MAAHTVDVVIIGGGPAGLSAALTLSRTMRTVALFDSRVYRNQSTDVMHNVPHFDGTNPTAYRNGMLAEIQKRYSATFRYVPKLAVQLRRDEIEEGKRPLFHVTDQDSEIWTARKVILATGVKDILPDIEGFDKIWGKAAIHCVFCHGTETYGKPIGVLLSPNAQPMSNTMTLTSFIQKFKNLKNHPVTVFANGIFGNEAQEPKAAPNMGISEELLKVAKARGFIWDLRPIKCITTETTGGVLGHNVPAATFHFTRGDPVTVPYVVHTPLTEAPASTQALLSHPSLNVLQKGLKTPNQMLKVTLGELPNSGMFLKSELEGVFIAGNLSLFMSTVVMSVGQGQLAAAGADHEIGMEDQQDELKACL